MSVALVSIGTYTRLITLDEQWIELIRSSPVYMEPLGVKQVEERLGQVKCAICKLSQFGIDSRTVTGDGNWKGICRSCYYTFPVYTDMEFYLRTQPDVPYRLRDLSCPVCEKHDFNLDFRIVMSVRESIYFLTCKSCQHAFHDWSFLETFE